MILLSSTAENLFQLVVVLFCFVLVLGLTYYSTRWIAGYQKKQSISKNLSVVETLKLTTNKYIQLVKAGKDKYFLIAVGKDEITFLGEIGADQLQEVPEIPLEDLPTVKGDFEDILNKFREHLPKK